MPKKRTRKPEARHVTLEWKKAEPWKDDIEARVRSLEQYVRWLETQKKKVAEEIRKVDEEYETAGTTANPNPPRPRRFPWGWLWFWFGFGAWAVTFIGWLMR